MAYQTTDTRISSRERGLRLNLVYKLKVTKNRTVSGSNARTVTKRRPRLCTLTERLGFNYDWKFFFLTCRKLPCTLIRVQWLHYIIQTNLKITDAKKVHLWYIRLCRYPNTFFLSRYQSTKRVCLTLGGLGSVVSIYPWYTPSCRSVSTLL